MPSVIPLKVFLRYGTRFLRGCYSRVAWMFWWTISLFRFVSFKSEENIQTCRDVFVNILITSKGAWALAMFSKLKKRSLNKRQMSPAQPMTTEWTAEKWLETRMQSKQTPNMLGNRTNRWKCKPTLSAQGTRCSLSNNGNNAKDTTSIK